MIRWVIKRLRDLSAVMFTARVDEVENAREVGASSRILALCMALSENYFAEGDTQCDRD